MLSAAPQQLMRLSNRSQHKKEFYSETLHLATKKMNPGKSGLDLWTLAITL